MQISNTVVVASTAAVTVVLGFVTWLNYRLHNTQQCRCTCACYDIDALALANPQVAAHVRGCQYVATTTTNVNTDDCPTYDPQDYMIDVIASGDDDPADITSADRVSASQRRTGNDSTS